MPSVLLFDLGGVLMDFAAFEHLAELAPGRDMEEVRTRWLLSPTVRAFELGELAPIEFAERFGTEWDLSQSPTELIETLAGWLKGFYPGARELLAELRPHYRIACLSNSNPVHWGEHRDSLLPHFDALFASHELGLLKPDPEIFRVVAEALGAPPAEVLFFDDAPQNVAAALAAGFDAVQARGIAELEARLTERGLLYG